MRPPFFISRSFILQAGMLLVCWHLVFFLPAAQYSTDEENIWSALSQQIENLLQQKKEKEAFQLLFDFQKHYPRSTHLPFIWLKMGEVLSGPLHRMEDGFLYLEKAENGGDPEIKIKAAELKGNYAAEVTQKRLDKIQNALLRYFIEHQTFPKELQHLISTSSVVSGNDLKDGYGAELVYELKNNPLFQGKNELTYTLFSSGKDGKKGSGDDLAPIKEISSSKDKNLTILNIYQEGKSRVAEIGLPGQGKNSKTIKKVKEGDIFQDYLVFGIGEQGVILLKEQRPLVIKRQA